MSGSNLLFWAIIFLVVAIIAGVFGFGGIAGTALVPARFSSGWRWRSAAVALLFGVAPDDSLRSCARIAAASSSAMKGFSRSGQSPSSRECPGA